MEGERERVDRVIGKERAWRKNELIVITSMSSFKVDVNQRMDTGYLWERFPSDVEKMLLIGEGTFGDVYSGVLHQTIGRKQFDDDSVNVFIATLKGTL